MTNNGFSNTLGMKSFRYILGLFFLVSFSAHGQTWFESCARIGARAKLFKEYWEENNNVPEGKCFLLNNKELIYSNEYGLMYQSLKTKKTESTPITGRNPGDPDEFVAINKKRYALISDSNMNQGWTTSNLTLLYLIPPHSRGPRSGQPFEAVILFSNQDSPDDCDESKTNPYCTHQHSMRFGAGVSEWVDFSSKSDFLRIDGPHLVRMSGLVSAIEFDLYFANEKKKFKTIRYSLKAGSSHFESVDLADVAKAVVARHPVEVNWIREQKSVSKK